MDDPIEKDYAEFHMKLEGSCPEEQLSLYTRELERLEFKLRDERLGYEHAKVDGEFLDEAEIENYLDRLALLIEKLRHERNGLESGKPVPPSSSPSTPSSKPDPASTRVLFAPGKPVNRKRLTMNQAAEYLGVAKQTLYQWCSERKLPRTKIGSKNVFDADELDAWVAKHKVGPMSGVVKARPAVKFRK